MEWLRRLHWNERTVPPERARRLTGIRNKAAYQNAQEILSLLQLICSQRETDNPIGSTNTPVQDVSAADEIRKFKALMEEGIITEEEFLAKKKQLLGL